MLEIDGISPLQEITDPLFDSFGVRVMMKRDDLLHPEFGGNKWRKLRPNLRALENAGKNRIVTFAGPFSNHLYAAAAAANASKLYATIYVRGEANDSKNPVLAHVRALGATIIPTSRHDFHRRNSPEFLEIIQQLHPDGYLIPEGGTNSEGLKGCADIVREVDRQTEDPADHWIVPSGTGGTALGIAQALPEQVRVTGILGLRGKFVEESLGGLNVQLPENLQFDERFHFGGLAKWDQRLIEVITKFERVYGILLDPLYTGKAMYGLRQMVSSGEFRRGSKVVFVHTGGRPGRMAFNYRYGNALPDPF